MLNGIENNLSQSLLKLEQYCMTSSNLEKDVEKDTKYLINQGAVIFELNSELKKLHTNIECRSRQIELETKKLETIKKKCDVRQFSYFIFTFHKIHIILFPF